MSDAASMRPAHGARFAVERAEESPAFVIYRGFVHLPEHDWPLELRIELPSGAITASIDEAAPSGLDKTAAALVRAATKAAVSAGNSLPRKIVRWRG